MQILAFLLQLRRQVDASLGPRVEMPGPAEAKPGNRTSETGRRASFCPIEEKVACACGRYYRETFTANQWTLNSATGELEFSERIVSVGRVTPAEKDRWVFGIQAICADPACHGFRAETTDAPALEPSDAQAAFSEHDQPAL